MSRAFVSFYHPEEMDEHQRAAISTKLADLLDEDYGARVQLAEKVERSPSAVTRWIDRGVPDG